MEVDNNKLQQNTNNELQKGNSFGIEPNAELPWEANEREKKMLEQSFLSKYWMLIVVVVLLLILPFTIININFNKTSSISGNNTNTAKQITNNLYLTKLEVASLFGINAPVTEDLSIYNNTQRSSLNSFLQDYANSLRDNITAALYAVYQQNITENGNSDGYVSVFFKEYKTLKPIYVYSQLFKYVFSNVSSVINNKTYNNLEYSIQEYSGVGCKCNVLNNGTSVSYNDLGYNIVAVKNDNVSIVDITETTYNNIKINAPTLNVTKLIYFISNYS